MSAKQILGILLLIGILGLFFARFALMGTQNDTTSTAASDIILPELTAAQQSGKALFDENCAACHGANATGTDQGPPLVHIIYEPSHHGDYSFVLAAQQGVRAHHWGFGDMPAVLGVSETDIAKIVDYVRALQRANGID